MVEVCERFKWDYHKYMNQPVWFLYLIHKKLDIDAKKQRAEMEKNKNIKKK